MKRRWHDLFQAGLQVFFETHPDHPARRKVGEAEQEARGERKAGLIMQFRAQLREIVRFQPDSEFLPVRNCRSVNWRLFRIWRGGALLWRRLQAEKNLLPGLRRCLIELPRGT